MGKNFCVCNNQNIKENESSIFSGINSKRHLEKETIKTLNSDNQMNQTSIYKSNNDENSSKNNYSLNIFVNEIYKNNNFNKTKNSNNKMLSEINKNDNFQCSGKFHVLQTNSNHQITNGGNEVADNNSNNVKDNKNVYNNGVGGNITNKNDFGFTSFKSFFDNNNNTSEKKENKDNNTNISISISKEGNQNLDLNKTNKINKVGEYNDTQNLE